MLLSFLRSKDGMVARGGSQIIRMEDIRLALLCVESTLLLSASVLTSNKTESFTTIRIYV